MIIDTSYFINNPLQIPNAVVQPAIGTNTPNNLEKLQTAISNMEYQFLLNALGKVQTTELLAQFESDGAWIVDPIQKWVDLVDGKDDWLGLRDSTRKTSLIANYVYYNFLLNDQVYYSITGLQRPDAANSNAVNPDTKLTREWNIFLFHYQGYYIGCNPTPKTFSMYNYMAANTDLYDSTYFSIYEYLNAWGI